MFEVVNALEALPERWGARRPDFVIARAEGENMQGEAKILRKAGAVRGCVIGLALCPLIGQTHDPGLRTITATDLITMQRPSLPPWSMAGGSASYSMSPDGKWIAWVLRRGDIANGFNEYSLMLLDTPDVQAFVRTPSRATLPESKRLARFQTRSPYPGISGVTWLKESNKLAFIGRSRGAGELAQLFAYDLNRATIDQITRHAFDVEIFQWIEHAQLVIYYALEPNKWARRNLLGYVVGEETLQDVLQVDRELPFMPIFACFVLDLRTGATTKLDFLVETFDQHLVPLLTSPSGSKAVFSRAAPYFPQEWVQYDHVAQKLSAVAVVQGAGTQQTAPNMLPSSVRQMHLADLKTGKTRPIIDVPLLEGALLRSEEVAWSADERSVILLNSYLPLTGVDAAERERRRHVSAVVELNLENGQVNKVRDWIPPPQDGDPAYLPSVRWISSNEILIDEPSSPHAGVAPATPRRWSYRKVKGRWRESSSLEERPTPERGKAPSRVKVAPIEGINRSAELEAMDEQTGQARVITDLNPGFRHRRYPRIEPFEWVDRTGEKHQDGLVYPLGYVPGKRYPLVVQTYGFEDRMFEKGSAFTYRQLSARGILVVQTLCETGNLEVLRRYRENGSVVRCHEDLIDTLDARGLIDRDRMGLIGFSRTGMHVQNAAVYSKHRFAAALIADSAQVAFTAYLILHGVPGPPGLPSFDQDQPTGPAFVGSPPFGEGIQRWLELAPTFNLHRVQTPLRYEAHGSDVGVLAAWEPFVILKRVGRPIELVHFPEDGHNLETPWGRHQSQEGNVDWFAFWLKGEEDADPHKFQQYRRWRGLKRQHELGLKN